MKKPIDKLIDMIELYNDKANNHYEMSEKIKNYVTKKKINLADVTKEISRLKNFYVVKNLISLDLCTDKQLSEDWWLHNYVKNESVKDVKTSLKNGANPNTTFNGDTALYRAVALANAEIVKILLDHGADPYIGTTSWNANNNSSLNKAAIIADEHDRHDILMLFLEKGVNTEKHFVFSKGGLIQTPYSTVDTICRMYENPESFLNLKSDQILSKKLKYFKLATIYGLQREANILKRDGKLSEEYIEKSKNLIEKINDKIKTVKAENKAKMAEENKKIAVEIAIKKAKEEYQEKLFEEFTSLTNNFKTEIEKDKKENTL